jgi:hypothetical protein
MSAKPASTARRPGRPKKTAAAPDWSEGKALDSASPAASTPAKPEWATKYGDASHWGGEFADVQENRLAIPRDVIDALGRENIVLEWKTEKVMGQPQDHATSIHRRNGWVEVGANELPGVHVVEVEGLRLMARPMEIHRKAKQREQSEASSRISEMHRKFSGGLDVVGGDHPSAINSNKMKRSLEKIEIPNK